MSAAYPRVMIGAVRDWRAKQTLQERHRWDQIWAYFRAEHKLPAGTVLPNGKIIIQSDSLPHRIPGAPSRLVVNPKTGKVTAVFDAPAKGTGLVTAAEPQKKLAPVASKSEEAKPLGNVGKS